MLNCETDKQSTLERIRRDGWIKHLDWFATIDSTSDYARRWLTYADAPVPALFVADEQSQGRGRANNRWWSPRGCLMLTLAIPDRAMPSHPHQRSTLSLVCGVATALAVEQVVKEASIQLKWPNDLYVDDRKMGGILIESVSTPGNHGNAVWLIGMGLNLSVNWELAPEEVRRKAVCLRSACGVYVDACSMLAELVNELHNWLGRWRLDSGAWTEAWCKRSLLTHRLVQVKVHSGHIVSGRCEGVDMEGRLLLRTETGLLSISTGEVLSWN